MSMNVYKAAHCHRKHNIVAMHPVCAFVVVFGCLSVGGSGYPIHPTFQSCQEPVCYSGAYIGYSCRGGVCDYVCFRSVCYGVGNVDASSNALVGSTHLVNPNATQLSLSAVPNIPPQYANILLNKDPGFVQYIIKNHRNLLGLLANMNTQTLQYVTAHVPKFGKVVSKINLDTLEMMFDKLPKIAKYLEHIDHEAVQAVEATLTSVAQHAPAEATTTAPPVTNLTLQREREEAEVTKEVPLTVVTKAPIFTDEELELVRSKIPLMEKFLLLADFDKLTHVHNTVPDVVKFIVDLEPSVVEVINSLLYNATNKLENAEMMLSDHAVKQMQEYGHLGPAASSTPVQDP